LFLNTERRNIQVVLKQRKVDYISLDWLDWTLFSTMPLLGNASLIAGAAGLIAEKSFAPYAIAGADALGEVQSSRISQKQERRDCQREQNSRVNCERA